MDKYILFGHSGSGKSEYLRSILRQGIKLEDYNSKVTWPHLYGQVENKVVIIYWDRYIGSELSELMLEDDISFYEQNVPYSIRILYNICQYIKFGISKIKNEKIYILIDNADRYLDRYGLMQLIYYLDSITVDRIIVTSQTKDLLDAGWKCLDVYGNTIKSYEEYYQSCNFDKIKNKLIYNLAIINNKLNDFLNKTTCTYDNKVINYLKLNIDLTEIILKAEQEIKNYFDDYNLKLEINNNYDGGIYFHLYIKMNHYSDDKYGDWLKRYNKFFEYWVDINDDDRLTIDV